MTLTPLAGQKLSTFSCGDDVLDDFLRTKAGQHQRLGVSRTHLRLDEDTVVGFVTVTTTTVTKDKVGEALRKYPRFPLPCLLLARIGVSVAIHRTRVGTNLFKHVLHTAKQLRDLAGCVGVWVDSKPGAVDWYKKLGFVPVGQSSGDLTPMFLPMNKIPEESPEPVP